MPILVPCSSRHVRDVGRDGREVLHRSTGGEEVRRSGPVGRHVVAVGRCLRLDQDIGAEKERSHAGHRKHAILVDQVLGQLGELARVAAVVERVLVVNLATVHAALGVGVVEVRPLAGDHRRRAPRQRTGLRRDGADRDGVRCHPRGVGGAGGPGECRCGRPERTEDDGTGGGTVAIAANADVASLTELSCPVRSPCEPPCSRTRRILRAAVTLVTVLFGSGRDLHRRAEWEDGGELDDFLGVVHSHAAMGDGLGRAPRHHRCRGCRSRRRPRRRW